MKKILPIFLILLLFGCSRGRDVDPEDITEIVYSYTFGFTGVTSMITIDPKKEVFEYFGRPDRCEKPITPAEWSKLVEGFDWNKFKKIKSNNEPVCCDIGGGGVKVTIGSKSHRVSWTYPAPKGIQEDFIKKLSERLNTLVKNCP